MYSILIADDEVIERTVLEKRLRRLYGEENELYIAQNGREALEIYKRVHPQIMIFDIEMPVISGLEAAKEIRRTDTECSIIFLTAFDEFAYAKKAIAVRALDYLLKPCDEEELANAVDEAMRICDARKASGRDRDTEKAADSTIIRDVQEQHRSPVPETEHAVQAGDAPAVRDEHVVPADNEPGDSLHEDIRKYIEAHYMNDIAVQDIADHFRYSEAYFCKLFRQYFGHSFVSYLTNYRMTKAQQLMMDSSMSIKEIGKAVGYPDPNYFAKVFRRVRGVSPSEYRNNADPGEKDHR